MEIIPFYEAKKLSNLIRFCLASDLLEIDESWYLGVFQNVVTPAYLRYSESQTLRQTQQVTETDIVNGALGESQQKLSAPGSHDGNTGGVEKDLVLVIRSNAC